MPIFHVLCCLGRAGIGIMDVVEVVMSVLLKFLAPVRLFIQSCDYSFRGTKIAHAMEIYSEKRAYSVSQAMAIIGIYIYIRLCVLVHGTEDRDTVGETLGRELEQENCPFSS